MASFTNEQIEAALLSKSKRLSQDDLRRIAQAKDAVLKMVAEFPDQWETARKQAALLFQMIEAASTGKFDAKPEDLKFAAGALIYLGDPLDLVPDEDEDGYADDAAIIALAVERSRSEVEAFCKTRGLEFNDYL